MAGVIKVHGHHGSTATATVLCCLNEKKVEYELVFIDFFEGDQKKP
jgi:glutathione S-transferase